MKKKLYSYIYCNVKIKGQCTQNMYKKIITISLKSLKPKCSNNKFTICNVHCCAIGLFSYLMKNNPSIVSVNYL